MTPQHLALSLAGRRGVSRLLGCGCLALAALAAIPFLLIAALLSTTSGVSGSGGDQAASLGVVGMVTGAGEPLQAGHFRVTQGFGCTPYLLEPPPPPPYTCPPDGAAAAVRFHTGIDLAAASGEVAYAVAAGTVRVVRSATGFGIHILLDAGSAGGRPLTYLYGHLSANAVPDGDHVNAGAPIGFVGSTGNSSGPHLHFEVDVGGTPVNPCSVFPAGYLVPAGVTAADCLAARL